MMILRIKIKKLSKNLFIVLSAVIITLTGLGITTVFANNSKTVKVAFFTDRPYYMTTSESGTRSGYAYDYLSMISNYTGWTYEYVYGEYDELKEQFLNGEIDVFPSIIKNAGNEQKMLFPDYPMGSLICRLYTLTDNTSISYDKPETLNGITIGITKDNALGEEFRKTLSKRNINCNFVEYQTHNKKIQAFENGNIDAIIEFEAMSKDNWNPVMMVGDYDYYMGILPERTDLVEEINYVLDELYETVPFYNDIMYYDNFSGEGNRRVSNEEEQKWISKNKKIKIGVIEYAMISSDTEQNAFVKTIISKMLEEINLSDLDVEYLNYASYDELVSALKNGNVDVAYPLIDNNNIAEENNYSVVETLEKSPMDIITKKKMDINDVKIIVVPDMEVSNYCKIIFPMAEIICFDSKKECLYAVEGGMADAAVMQCHLINDDTEAASVYDDLIFTDCPSMGSALAVRKDQTELYSILRRGIGTLDEDYINHISVGMNNSNVAYGLSDFIYEYYWLVNTIIIVIGVLLIIVLYLVRLRKRNQKRHKEATIYQCALYSQAVGYFQCNLSKDLMMSPYMKMIDGEPTDIIDYIPFPTGAPFSSLMDYIASHYVVSTSGDFREFMNPDALVKSYHDGNFKPEFSCWVTVPNNGDKVFQRYVFFLSDNSDGDIIATCIVYDQSEHEGELEKQRIKAEAANIAKSTFLFNMSHDVRTPMNAIIGYANMAEKNIRNTEKVSECITKIQSSSEQLLSLMDDALDMSRVESGKVIIKEEPVNIINNINRIKDSIVENARLHGIELKFHMGNMENYEVYVDSMHLNKILFNVVDNAIKYSKPGGDVKVTISQKKLKEENFARYIFVIEDHGIGMSNDFLTQIYDMFAREESSTISGVQGTGVGMAITKKLVDLMNGEIAIDSEKGKGTRVRLQFDFQVRKPVEKVEEVQQEEEVSLEGKRILLVEDIDLNREIAREILEEEGLIVEEAIDGSVAVDMVSDSEPGYYDLVFMDIQMPIMDGYEATRRIRALENKKLAQIPIVAMTANALDEDIQNSLEAGMNAHLSKPINIVEMFNAMHKYIKV